MTQDLLSQPDQTSQPLIDPAKNYFEDLVGEGKRYKDNEALAKAKLHADFTIEERNRELKEHRDYILKLQENSQQQANLKELYDQLKQLSTREPNHQAQEVSEQPKFDPNQIKDLVSSTVKELSLADQQNKNFTTVMDKLRERWGENYSSSLQQQMGELGITREELNDMARKNPKVLIRTLGLDQKQQSESFDAPPRNAQRSSFAPTTQKRTWSYYTKMRDTDPTTYFTKQVQDQLIHDHMTLGTAFEDGDWND
jgi:hypothetical protein